MNANIKQYSIEVVFISLSLIGLMGAEYCLYYYFFAHAPVYKFSAIPLFSMVCLMATLGLAFLANMMMYKYFQSGFLLTVFLILISSRIAALHDLYLYSGLLFACIIIMLMLYRYFAEYGIQSGELTLSESVLVFLRMYVGFNLIPHFTEKLFAGDIPRMADVQAFAHLGIPHPEIFVVLAGLCELIGAISIGLGLFTRAGALFTVIYLFIATYLGKHFTLGFIWAGAGGGWEYPVLWMMLVMIFVIMGAPKFSLDAAWKAKHPNQSKIVHWMMG